MRVGTRGGRNRVPVICNCRQNCLKSKDRISHNSKNQSHSQNEEINSNKSLKQTWSEFSFKVGDRSQMK